MTFSAEKFKQQFPLFAQSENRSLVYLDNAATTQKPACVIDAISDFYLHSNANTHRSSHRLARRATEMVEKVRRDAAAFLGAHSPREIIFTRGATEGLNLLANSLCAGLCPGDEILLSTAEHHANLVPWQMMAERYGLKLCFVPDEAGVPRFDRISEVLTPRTRVVSVTAGSNALGIRTDLHALRKALSGHDLVWVLDGAQLAAHDVVDVASIGCDFFVCSAHKFYGPTGIGLVFGRESLLQGMPPWQGGGEMIANVDLLSSEFAGLPHRFEAGTSSLASIAGLGACIDFLARQNRAEMARHEQILQQYLHERLAQVPELVMLSHGEDNLGIATFVHPRCAAVDLAQWLDGRDIAVRVGHHCAQPLLRAAGHTATVRASIAAYNTREDMDRFIAGVEEFLLQLDTDGVEAAPQPSARSTPVAEHWSPDDLSALDLDELRRRHNWQDRYRTLMGWAKAISRKEIIRSQENLVRGCESSAWLVHRCEDTGVHRFAIDSDSRIVKGLGALLLSLIDGQASDAISRDRVLSIFDELGLAQQLSDSRSNGFRALLDRAFELLES
ncbi:aminotransferase class V-fold PLP-dependent enzyme [Microbulbifer hydrolyticus]|uniref:cysteine desulfurase n=1 Tax=Microbulbifer hydrolyticus TaxID=48074 RepID=A0A6P1TAP5_9GAMM|nr:aminotransferase class V-fold PLP-dependent enzyme [Microbulbifer hydrolyticus]MBB5210703.1 SufS family cysteine desulfurase [Microbulbifer hydrolyticus]QHQ38841.1 aminotransferase class V-fold PLP-dependent enzyme [Microbulbifer hydrolyticus]